MKQAWERDDEYLSHVGELLVTDSVQLLGNFVHHYHTTRLEHSLNVSYTSFQIAKKLRGNARSTARAALLHDLFFYIRKERKKEKRHAYLHPRIALQEAEKITELSDLERDIILKHMWGVTLAPPRYKESFIVTFVDKYWAVKEMLFPLEEKWKNRKFFRRKSLKECAVK